MKTVREAAEEAIKAFHRWQDGVAVEWFHYMDQLRRALEREQEGAIHVVVCDRDDNMPTTRTYPIVMETRVTGATVEVAIERAKSLCAKYGECRVARLEFVGEPIRYSKEMACQQEQK